MELHRRYYHEKAKVLQDAMTKAGVPQAVIDDVPNVLRLCSQCRARGLLPPKAVVTLLGASSVPAWLLELGGGAEWTVRGSAVG